MNNIKLEKRITLKYVGALVFIAILATSSFYVLYKSLETSNSTAYIVNISGKQRMLSQHIALDVYKIHNSFNEKDLSFESIKKLLIYTKEMMKNNKILSTGVLPNGNKITLSKKIHNMYFGEMNLKKRVDEYVKIANQITKLTKHIKIDAILSKIDSQSEELLIDLNKAVKEYEIEGKNKLNTLKSLDIIAWVLIMVTLLLEVIFVFKSMLKTVMLLLTENKNTLQNLENEVRLRTLKLQDANSKLKKMAFHDPMTGLRNRLTLESDIEKAIQHYEKHHSPFAILMFDIDWFKNVNDTYGHDVGDKVIKDVSTILKSSVREEDKVYRAGGEEFVILLNRISLDDAVKIADKIRLLIEKHDFISEDAKFNKTISGGLYHSSICKAKNTTDALKMVDKALYKSKETGRNKVTSMCMSK